MSQFDRKTLKPLLLSLLGATLALSLGTAFWYRTALAEMVINAWQGYKLTDGLVGYWSFDAGDIDWTQNKAFDRSGQGNHGTFTNMATATAPVIGKIGQAVGFDGVDDFTTISVADTNFLGAITISAWVKPTTVGPIVSKVSGNGAINNPFDFELANVSGVNALYSVRAHASSYSAYTGPAWTSGVWQHIVVVYTDGDTNTPPTYYVNGVAGAASQIFSHTTGSVTGASKPILIGKRDDGQIITSQIDDVRIYNRALSAEEVKRLYLMGGSFKVNTSRPYEVTNGLIGYWPFDGSDIDLSQPAAEIRDRSGQGNNGDWKEHATTTVIGRIGQGVSFDGTNDRVDFGDKNAFDGNAEMTVSAWVRSSISITSARTIMRKQPNTCTGANGVFALGVGWTASKARFWVNNGTSFENSGDSSTSIDDGNWHLVTGIRRGSTAYIYVDGALENSGALTGSTNSSADFVTIGGCADGVAELWNGSIDDVRFYNRALSAEEVKRLYLMGNTFVTNSSQNQKLTDGLVGLWSFDGPDIDLSQPTAEIRDRSGQGNNGDWVNHSTTTAIGKMGQGISLNGANNNYISFPTSAVYRFPSGDFTVSCWIKTAGYINRGSGANVILSNEGLNSSAMHYAFALTATVIEFGKGTTFITTSATPYTDDNWHFLVGRRSSSTLEFFIDNQSVGTSTASDTSGTTGLFIGNDAGSGGGSRAYTGSLDDVRIYNRALSAEEVKRLYLMGK